MSNLKILRAGTVLLVLLPFFTGPASAQTPLGAYTDHEVGPSSVTVWADTSGMRLTWYRRDVVRVDLLPRPTTTRDSSVAVIRDPQGIPVNVQSDAEAVRASTPGLTAVVQKDPVRVRFKKGQGQTLLREPSTAGFVADGETRRVQFRLPSDTRFYGTGERGIGLNLRGERFQSYNEQHFGYNGPLSTMNINVPLLLTTSGYALLFDDPYPGTFDLGARDPSTFSYEAEDGQLSYFVLAGSSIPEQLETYTWLTGRPPMPPKWALGYLQSKYGYRSAEAARETVARLREEDIPADGLILDLYWFERMGDFNWDRSAFPNPSQMISDFEAKGLKTLVITEPYVTEGSDWFAEMVGEGAPRPALTYSGQPFRLRGWWSCGCDAVLADVTHAPTREWWTDRYDEILSAGVHGLWTDLGEPEAHPVSMQHTTGSATAVHNIYNLLWTRTVHHAFREQRPNRRFVNLTRAGYAGIQRYGVFTWSADVARSYQGLAVQRPIMLQSSLSGLYYHSSDLGGFIGQGSGELYARWMQMGAFTPVARAHGIDNAPTEPWGYGEQVLNISRKYLNLRYRLLPYLYTMAYRAHDTGMPIIRPLFFENPDAARLAEEDDAYLFGDSFLVAPVVERGKRQKTVPLPPGTWINYWTDRTVMGGGTVTVDAPLDRLPLFVRAGSIIPMRPTAPDAVGHSVADTLQLSVYPDPSPSAFTFYEDDGYTRAYERGSFATTTFSQRRIDRDSTSRIGVTLGQTTGSFEGLPARRTYHVLLHHVEQSPQRVTVDAQVLPDQGRPKTLREGATGYAYETDAHRLHVRTTVGIRAEHRVRAYLGDGPLAVESAYVHTNTPVVFESAGLRMEWKGVQQADTVTVERYGEPPSQPEGIGEGRATSDRFVVGAGPKLRFESVTLTLAARRLSGIDDPSRVTIYRRTQPGTGGFEALPTHVDENGTPNDPSDDSLSITTEALGEFVPVVASRFPLELDRFEAAVQGDAVVLRWRPVEDTQRHFRVQRAFGDASWTRIGTVVGSTRGRSYRFVDEDVPYAADSVRYRVVRNGERGRMRSSRVLTVGRSVSSVELRPPAPNPARQSATLRYAVPTRRPVTLRLYDILGRQVRTIVNTPQQGRQEQRVDLSGLSSGTYFLRLRVGKIVRTERLTVVR